MYFLLGDCAEGTLEMMDLIGSGYKLMGHRSVEGTVHKSRLLTEGCRDYYNCFFTMMYIT